MKGQADMLLANRTLSAFIVVCLVVSVFAGLFAAAPKNVGAASLGDLNISSGTYIIQDIDQAVDGNVTVSGSGNLTIKDATLSIISNYATSQRHTITVQGTGQIYLDHGTITSYLDQISPWPFIDLNVVSGGHLIASGQSTLMFPGTIVVSANSHVVFHDTQIVKLPDSEVSKYVVGSNGLITMDSADDGPAVSISDSTFEMYDSGIVNPPEYVNRMASNITLGGNSFMIAVNSYIGVDFGPTNVVSDWYKHNSLVLSGTAQAELYGCSFASYVGSDADRQSAITATGLSGAHIYRWLNVTVGDAYGVPISGADVGAVFTGSGYAGQPAFYYLATGATQNLPPNQVLAYMGKTSLTFGVTESDGIATVPLVTDLITGGSSALFIGTYALTGTATILSVDYSSTESYSFPAYPAMMPGDRSFDVTVEIAGISVPSPDPSRWLVVPVDSTHPSLTIEDMTYYHAGDVIVAAGGTLTFSNALFELVQSYPNQRTVYVDGTQVAPGKLVFEGSTMTSALDLNIMVKGYGILEILNSTLVGVNVVALEHSTVILKNAYVDRQISTSWDSQAMIDVKDSDLVQPIVLSGNAWGGFTNTSVPSIRVTDNAVAMIYRWIHVTVFDGAGKPLPNATVSAYYLINGTFAKSATTNWEPLMRGVAQINAEGTRITSIGSTFVGNYRVSAVYNWGGTPYWADENISVGVMPYSEPLGRNATYATMTISSAVPHLFINQQMGPIVASPSNPIKNTVVTLNATVNNSGPVGAYNVKVDFFDQGPSDVNPILVDTVVIPWIAPGASAVATGHWLAPPPVGLQATNHTISIIAYPGIANLPNVTGSTIVTVQALPDLAITDVSVSSTYLEINTATTISATLSNIGDTTASSISVNFLDNGVSVLTTSISALAAYHSLPVTATWSPGATGTHTITVVASIAQTEMSLGNNAGTITREVYPHPDMMLTQITFAPSGPISGGSTVVAKAILVNTGRVPISMPTLKLEASGPGMTTITASSPLNDVLDLNDGNEMTVEISFIAPVLRQQTVVNVTLTINPDGTIIESNFLNNNITGSITVLDVRPDLSVVSGEIYIKRGATEVTSEQFGKTITLNITVQNLGGQAIMNPGFDATIGVRTVAGATTQYNVTLFNVTDVDIGFTSTNHSTRILRNWAVSVTTPGQYEIWVYLDPKGTIDEPSKTNNFATKNFTLNALSMNAIVTSSSGTEFKAGDMITVSASFTYTDTGTPVKSLPHITFWLVDPTTNQLVPGSNSETVSADPTGMVATSIRVPVGLASGDYVVRANVTDSPGPYDSSAIHVSAVKKPSLLPMWAWLAIIVGAVAIVLGFLGYTYKYGLGKLVECGECGAFIPAASKRCPKCGVEFEVGTMKCSECGAWIPAESTECPNCGVKFVGETEDEADYLERMRAEYDEMTSKYRELAKTELGRKFTDRQFEDWFRRQPGYISFDDWLAKEEEKKAEGPIPCKVCGTLNPKEATVCHKCGTVFTKEQPPKQGAPPQGGQPVQQEQPAEQVVQPAQQQAPRMVIRRPIDRKVVPKKIIKSPVEGETEDQQQ